MMRFAELFLSAKLDNYTNNYMQRHGFCPHCKNTTMTTYRLAVHTHTHTYTHMHTHTTYKAKKFLTPQS